MDGADPNNNNDGNDGGQGGDEDSVNSINPDDVGYLPADHVKFNFYFQNFNVCFSHSWQDSKTLWLNNWLMSMKELIFN